jgi:serine/threonine protein kinase
VSPTFHHIITDRPSVTRHPLLCLLTLTTECALTCHAHCQHLVPDFCGMSMAVANQILEGIRTQKQRQAKGTSLTERTLRPGVGKGGSAAAHSPSPSYSGSVQSQFGAHSPSSEAAEAAKATYQGQAPGQRQSGSDRPSPSSTSTAAAAASAAMSSPTSQRPEYDRYGSFGQPSPEDPYAQASQYGAASQQQQPSSQQQQQQQQQQQRRYNPADYAAVSQGYPAPTPAQSRPAQQTPPQQQQQQQQPPPQVAIQQPQQTPYQQVPTPPIHQGQVSEPAHASSPVSPSTMQRKPLPLATDAGSGKRIGLDNFNFLAVLGKGNFGKVMLAETKRSRKLYAIKVLKKEFIIENDEVESIRSEKRVFLIANRERHPFLTNLHACFQTETRVYFVMEYISGGDLMLHIQRGQFGTKRAQFYAAEVCLALKYFHENGVIYRDLKLDNILLTLDGHIKIADYGLCKEDMWYGTATSTFCGTPEFMAPEILLDKKYGRSVDWWAFGVLIYQMLLQQSPFRGEDEDEIYDAILADEPLYPIHMARDSVSILQKLLTREPDQRLGSGPTDAQEVMSQPFFRNINWEDIYHKRVEPPFLPKIKSATDTSNFDSEFTSVTPVLTPVQSVLSQAMQEEFRGFSYTGDFD